MIHAFHVIDTYILLDVESGAIHALDERAYEVARALETETDPYALPIPRETVEEILSEFSQLRESGAFDAPMADAPEIAGGPAVKSLCLHVAHDCNLRCQYCFASTGDFHGERTLMRWEAAKAALELLIEKSGSRRQLEVDLFGGEPLLNFPLCKRIVEYGRELESKFEKCINFTITTNCVALTDEMMAFINDEMHNVVISLDGRKDVHDALRKTVNGKGSYDVILEKAKQLVAGRKDKEYYVRGTYTRNNLDFAEDVKHLTGEGFDQISLEPVVLPQSDPLSITSAHLPRIREEYARLAGHYLKERYDGKWFNFFHFNIDPAHGPCLRKRLSGCGAGTEYLAVAPDGTLYPCHQFVGRSEWALGNVFDGVIDENKQAAFAACNVLTKPDCRACWAKYYCSGGCAANADLYNGDIRLPHAISCELMRMRTECAIAIHVRENE